MKKTIVVLILCVLSLMFLQTVMAKSAEELAAESEAFCTSTRKEGTTPPSLIVSKVEEGCRLLQKEGTAAFDKFKGTGSPFIFQGTYIWIHSQKNTTMLMHPIKFKMEGKRLIGLKDKKGKRFFSVMNKLVKENGAGWVEYLWPKPGTKDIVRKISYVKGCMSADGVAMILGCGIYNADAADLSKLDIQ